MTTIEQPTVPSKLITGYNDVRFYVVAWSNQFKQFPSPLLTFFSKTYQNPNKKGFEKKRGRKPSTNKKVFGWENQFEPAQFALDTDLWDTFVCFASNQIEGKTTLFLLVY